MNTSCVEIYITRSVCNYRDGMILSARSHFWGGTDRILVNECIRLVAEQLKFIQCIWSFIFQGGVAGQFTAASSTCPGDTFTFRCTVTGDMSGITIWRVDGGSSECPLVHTTIDGPRPCGSGSPFTVATGSGFGTNATSFSSTLSGTASPRLDGTLVECFGPDLARNAGNTVGKNRLQILGQHFCLLEISSLCIVNMWQSQVEIEHYSVVYFKLDYCVHSAVVQNFC